MNVYPSCNNMSVKSWSCHDLVMNTAKHGLDYAMMTAWRLRFLTWSPWSPGLTWHANHTMHHRLPYIKTSNGNTNNFLFLPITIVWKVCQPLNLYGQLMTLTLFCKVIQWLPCFSWIFFPTNIFQFLIYIVPSNSKVLNTSKPKGESPSPIFRV